MGSFNGNKSVELVSPLKVGRLLGQGGYGAVYRATTCTSEGVQFVLALKKSRVSLRVKRPPLKHEARILQLLRGHPAISSVYGYGRFRHFEYLGMELLGSSLADIHKDHTFPLNVVLSIADQMISALAHIHAHGVIHRDIKPSNILIGLNNQLRLIDFGIARPFLPGEPGRDNSHMEAHCIVGTLDWASLHAHYGDKLSPRDDVESLAFTLLFFLRGDLPWQRYSHSVHGTLAGRAAQVRQKKVTWTGSKLADGYPAAFGHLLDSARSLGFHDKLDYDGWRSTFQKLADECGYNTTDNVDWALAGRAKVISPTPTPTLGQPIPPCIVRPGQLVYVQVLSRTTIEGYSSQADPSYWHDPDLSSDDWMTKRRPAIVLQTLLKEKKYYMIKVIPVKRGPRVSGTFGSSTMRLANEGSATDVLSVPDWPLDDALCYAFPLPETFVSVPQAASVSAHWIVKRDDVKSLLDKFDREPDSISPTELRQYISPIDLPNYKQMKWRSTYETYARFTPMTPENVAPPNDNATVDWFGERGWFDELVRINRKRSAQNGLEWTCSNIDKTKQDHDFSNSYWGMDVGDWHIQHERGRSLTLPASEVPQLDRDIHTLFQILDDEKCYCDQCKE